MKPTPTILFAVTLAAGTAAADPIEPLTLRDGRPACGNIMTKGPRPPCAGPTEVVIREASAAITRWFAGVSGQLARLGTVIALPRPGATPPATGALAPVDPHLVPAGGARS